MTDLDIRNTGNRWIAGLQGTGFLAVSHKVFTSRELSAKLPSLVSLIISGESEEPFSILSFTGIPKLETLTLTDV